MYHLFYICASVNSLISYGMFMGGRKLTGHWRWYYKVFVSGQK